MNTLTVRGEKETERLGTALARQLRAGDVLLLRGDLGAGKTVLARGVARGLGVEGPVASPTFTLMNVYDEARVPLCHFDLYRLDDEDSFYGAGLDEFVGGRYVALIEWPERCEDALPPCRLEIAIERADEDDARNITLTPVGGFRALEAL